MSDREVGTLAWSFDDLREQIDIIKESFEDVDRDPVVLRGFTKSQLNLQAAHDDRETLSIQTETGFGADAFSSPGNIEGLAEADLRLYGITVIPPEYASEQAQEMAAEGDS